MGVPVTTTAAALVPVVIGTPVGTVDAAAKTPLDQGMGEADTAITQALRRAVVADNTLSVRGQNVIIITKDRSVTLRGVVASAAEQAAIAALAQKTPGVSMVYDQMQTVQQ
jgi:osmotically-inducible protein OsmY